MYGWKIQVGLLKTQVRVRRVGKRKYWRRKYEFAGLEYASTENI